MAETIIANGTGFRGFNFDPVTGKPLAGLAPDVRHEFVAKSLKDAGVKIVDNSKPAAGEVEHGFDKGLG